MVEILVVLAIIAILASIMFVSLGNQRQRARVAGALSSVKSAMPITITCQSFDGDIQSPNEMGGNPVCNGSAESPEGSWPVLSNNCKYCGLSSDELSVRFTCADICVEGEDSVCNIKSGKCEQKK